MSHDDNDGSDVIERIEHWEAREAKSKPERSSGSSVVAKKAAQTPASPVRAAPAASKVPTVPVPADVRAKGAIAVNAYVVGYQRAMNRMAAWGGKAPAHSIAVARMVRQGLSDDEITARLQYEATDAQEQAMVRQAEIRATWDRAIAAINPNNGDAK